MQLDKEIQNYINNHSQALQTFNSIWKTFVILGASRHIATYGNLKMCEENN